MAHQDASGLLAQDAYSQTLARLLDNPAAVATKGSTLNLTTLLGHSETWIVRTIRVDGADTVLVQRINVEGGLRLVLPPEVASAAARQRDGLNALARRRGARQAVSTKREQGQTIGNPAALLKARKARKK
jgi:hypothetical protein